MAGSIKKIWPWKEIIQIKIIGGKPQVIWGANIMPETLNSEFWGALSLAIVGFIAVLIIERLASVKDSD
jgi:putative membrane protein